VPFILDMNFKFRLRVVSHGNLGDFVDDTTSDVLSLSSLFLINFMSLNFHVSPFDLFSSSPLFKGDNSGKVV
jgi:hypothetical protein